MPAPVKVTVYSDYLWPWCYNAAVRLHRIKDAYGKDIDITWKAYPLRVEPTRGRRPDDHSRESWGKAGEMGASDGIRFHPWPDDRDMPTHSLPALEAGKCAELQGPEAFLKYHEALLKAYFEENRDIADRQTLLDVAREVGLDVERLAKDLDSGSQRAAVMADLEEARQKRIQGIPTAIFLDKQGAIRIIGEVPLEQYRRVVDWLLAT